ncbi:hypothetical protein QN277_005732 [Acacia crassicarpa]|uniref:F-box domain-containing protein n=1 Tax=Acacia crassicarpa TaxID=499986 RepID=A0AAE1J0A0_9FABA|nr:hypothetical protein QN277_005732 [Acacia crassicarpa]
MDDDFPILPPESIRNILKRLPVKSLMRFQCVCRGWRTLFKTESFIADHLDHSNHQNPCLLMKDFDINEDFSNMHCLDSKMQVWEFQNPLLLSYVKQGKILGSSNGLFCVQIDKPDGSPHFLLVCNPAIREVRLVPETNIRKDHWNHLVGFGFSPIINDYKIVIAYSSFDHANVSIVKVYSLSSGSWKEEKKFRLNDTGGGVSSSGVTVNGVMFWWGYKTVGEVDGKNLIVSFDLAVEVFTVTPTPQLHEHVDFTVYEEKLAILSSIQDSTHSLIDLWVMEEGVGASGEIWVWTKKYSIDIYPRFLSPRTIWRNEIVGYSLGERESTVVFLNLTTKKTWKFAIGKFACKEWIFNYAESLVPVGGMKSSTIFL